MFAEFKKKQKDIAEKKVLTAEREARECEAVDTAAFDLLKKSKKQVPCVIMADKSTLMQTFGALGARERYRGSSITVQVTKLGETIRKIEITEG